jgi:drug/metabolite transporter (DMT)-like permease
MVYSILLALSDTYAVTKLKPSFVAMWVVLEPAFTATISAIFVHEDMSTIEILGSILTCCGLAVVLSSYQSGSKKEESGGPTEASSAAGKAISDKSPLLA